MDAGASVDMAGSQTTGGCIEQDWVSAGGREVQPRRSRETLQTGAGALTSVVNPVDVHQPGVRRGSGDGPHRQTTSTLTTALARASHPSSSAHQTPTLLLRDAFPSAPANCLIAYCLRDLAAPGLPKLCDAGSIANFLDAAFCEPVMVTFGAWPR
jgi:hypothetical protein